MRGKVAIINFWERWCSPCMLELPFIENVFQEIDEEQAQVLTITSDQEQAIMVVEEHGYSFPVLIDENKELSKQLKVLSIPRTFVIDPQGIIRAVHIGYHKYMEKVLKEEIIKWTNDEE